MSDEKMSFGIVEMDCIQGLKTIGSETIDIIICDPPYNIGKDFGNESDRQAFDDYVRWCDQWLLECVRILKPCGLMYVYGFSETLAHLLVRVQTMGVQTRWLVWHYTNKVVPSLHFWQRSHESILCCYKKNPIFLRDNIREPYSENYMKQKGRVRKGTKGRFSNGTKETLYQVHEKGALPRDVIKIPALAGGAGRKERVDHPTQKPIKLCQTLIRASKVDHDIMLVVPFAGSGSECVAAKMEGIRFLGFEINPDYVALCKSRLDELESLELDDA